MGDYYENEKIAALFLALILIVSCIALPGCTESAEETAAKTGEEAPDGAVFTLGVSTTQASESSVGKAMAEACAKMEDESNGRLQFDIYYSSTLLSPFDVLKGVSNGLADIAFCPSGPVPDYFPLSAKLLVLPFMGYKDVQQAYDIYHQLSEEFPEIEEEVTAQGVMTLDTFFTGRCDLYMTSNKTVDSLDDLKGMKIAVCDIFLSNILNEYGAAPVNISMADVYTTLENGVAEGVIQHSLFIKTSGSGELVKSCVRYGSGGLTMNLCKYIMNIDSYNNLPEDLQTIVTEGWTEFTVTQQNIETNDSAESFKALEDAGVNFVDFSDEDCEPLINLADTIKLECINELDAQGINAQSIYDEVQRLVRETE